MNGEKEKWASMHRMQKNCCGWLAAEKTLQQYHIVSQECASYWQTHPRLM